MTIDCHFHLDTSLLPIEGLVQSMDRQGIERVALIPRLNPPLAINPLLAAIALPVFRHGLHRSQGRLHRAATAIYQSNVKSDGTVDILGTRYPVLAQPPNAEVAEAVRAYPDRFYGWFFVNPAGPANLPAEIDKFMTLPGMIGVKAHPYWHNYPVRKLLEVAAWCEAQDKPMLIHLGAGENGDFKLLPRKFPRLKIIYAHAGVPESIAVCDLAGELKNVFVDLSSTSYVDLSAAREAVKRAGVGKCLFGTDGPYFHIRNQAFDFAPLLMMIARLKLSPLDRERVLTKNFFVATGLPQ